MFTLDEWKKVRPSAAKGSGIAKALLEWEQHCKSKTPANFQKYEDFEKADDAMVALRKALMAAEAKLNAIKPPDSKVVATKKLIQNANAEIKTFVVSCTSQKATNEKAANQVVTAAETTAQKGIEELRKLEKSAKDETAEIDNLVEALGKDAKDFFDDAALREAETELLRFKKSIEGIAKEVKDQVEELKRDKTVVEWRGAGAQKLLANRKADPKLLPVYTQKFQHFTTLLNTADEIGREVALIGDKYEIVITRTLNLVDRYQTSHDTYTRTYEKLLEVIERQHNVSKSITVKNASVGSYRGSLSDIEALYKQKGAPGVAAQMHGCQSQIDQLAGKLKTLKTFVDNFTKLGIDVWATTPANLRQATKPLFNQVVKRQSDIIAEIQKWEAGAADTITKLEGYHKLLNDFAKRNMALAAH